MTAPSPSSALAEPAEPVPAPVPERSRERIDRLAKAVLVALATAFVLAVAAGDGLGSDSGSDSRLGGDYPAFHAAGAIVLAGDLDQLYDAGRQQAEQVGLGFDGYLAFAYPPHVAAGYAPLAALGFRVGYAVHTLLMVAAIVATIRFLQRPVETLVGFTWPATAVVLGFYPVFKAVGGGQNTAVTMLVFATVWWALHEDREVVAGVAIGLLLYRPQYALPLIGLLALDRRWRAVAAAGSTAALLWISTAAFMGWGWVGEWIDRVVPFVETDAEVNAANSISLLGFGQAVLGADNPVALAVGFIGAAGVAAVLVWMWLPRSATPLPVRMGTTAAGVLLLSPHTMFYDAGLLVITAAAVLVSTAPQRRRVVLVALAAAWAFGFVHLLGGAIGATPLVLVVIGFFAAVVSMSPIVTKRRVVSHA